MSAKNLIKNIEKRHKIAKTWAKRTAKVMAKHKITEKQFCESGGFSRQWFNAAKKAIKIPSRISVERVEKAFKHYGV